MEDVIGGHSNRLVRILTVVSGIFSLNHLLEKLLYLGKVKHIIPSLAWLHYGPYSFIALSGAANFSYQVIIRSTGGSFTITSIYILNLEPSVWGANVSSAQVLLVWVSSMLFYHEYFVVIIF
jgi:hypothetical protein